MPEENEQPFISPAEATKHGYWGRRAPNSVPNEEMTVAGVLKAQEVLDDRAGQDQDELNKQTADAAQEGRPEDKRKGKS